MNDLDSMMTDDEIRKLAETYVIDPDRFLEIFLELFPTREMDANTISQLPAAIMREKKKLQNQSHSIATKVKEDVQ